MRVLIVHEEPIVAAGLMAVLSPRSEFELAASPSVSECLRSGRPLAEEYDVVVTDYEGGIELIGELKRHGDGWRHDSPRVLVLTQRAREWEVRFAVNAGIFGYLLQGCSAEEVVTGVRLVGTRRRYLCESVAERIAESLTRVSLTGRETEVLELMQRGMCNKTIARDLGVAPGTVKAHVRGILEKLESSTRTQAVAVAMHRGLIRSSVQRDSGVTLRPLGGDRSAERPQQMAHA